jgi:hypothetical protein
MHGYITGKHNIRVNAFNCPAVASIAPIDARLLMSNFFVSSKQHHGDISVVSHLWDTGRTESR